MAEKLDPKDTLTIEELAISNMWEIAAIVELLEWKVIKAVGLNPPHAGEGSNRVYP